MSQIIKSNFYFFICFFLFLLLGIGVIIFIPKNDVVIFINERNNTYLDIFFYYITYLGNGWFYFIIIIMLAFYRYYYSLLGLICFVLTSAIVQLLKNFVFDSDNRPKKLLEGIYDLHSINGMDIHSYYSFPSGHTVTAFSIICLLSLIQKNKSVAVIYFLFALLVGISRIYLGQHFFTDVYAGAILGVSITLLIFYFTEKYFQNNNWSKKSLKG